MNDARSGSDSDDRNWLDKITQLFSSEPKTREDLLDVLKVAKQNDVIDNEALGILEGALQVANQQVRDIMISSSQMVVVNVNEKVDQFMSKIIESAHSRFPVVGTTPDEVLGILLAKDLLPQLLNNNEPDLRALIRPVTFVPESKRLNVLLREFRQTRNHMAIVLDEYGSVSGLVTIEDVLEEIVGEIEDEHDPTAENFISKIADNDYLIKALTPIESFNRQFNADFSEDDFDTIGGILMQKFGYLPKPNELTTIDGFKFRVVNADNRQIHLLRMTPVSAA